MRRGTEGMGRWGVLYLVFYSPKRPRGSTINLRFNVQHGRAHSDVNKVGVTVNKTFLFKSFLLSLMDFGFALDLGIALVFNRIVDIVYAAFFTGPKIDMILTYVHALQPVYVS